MSSNDDMTSSSASDDGIPDFLRIRGAGLQSIRFADEQHPFDNSRTNATGNPVIPGSAKPICITLPLFYFTREASAYVHINKDPSFKRSAVFFLTLLAVVVDVFALAWERSTGLVRDVERKSRRRARGGGAAGRGNGRNSGGADAMGLAMAQIVGASENPESSSAAADRMNESDERGGENHDESMPNEDEVSFKELAPENANPLAHCVEVIYSEPKNGRPMQPVALRSWFFFNTTRSDIPTLFYSKFKTFAMLQAATRNNKRKFERTVTHRTFTDCLTFEDYFRMVAAYSHVNISVGVFNESHDFANHPIVNPTSPYNPFNAFSVEDSMRKVTPCGADPMYGIFSNYRDEVTDQWKFPRPESVFLYLNDMVRPFRYFSLVWPHKVITSVDLLDDVNVRAMAAIKYGMMPEDETSVSAKRLHDDLESSAYAVTDVAFSTEEDLKRHMHKKLTALKEDYDVRVRLADGDEEKKKELFTAYCDKVYALRLEGINIFKSYIWTEESKISKSKKAIVRWTNEHLNSTDAVRTKKQSNSAVNFSIPYPKQTLNLPRIGDILSAYMSVFETGYNVISLQSTIVRELLCAYNVFSANPLKINILLTSLPGIGKSFAASILRAILIPGTVVALDGFTIKSMLRSEGELDYMVIIFDEVPLSKVGTRQAKGNSSSSADPTSNGDETEAILKKMIAEGIAEYSYVEKNENSGKLERKHIRSYIRTMWLFHSNDSLREFAHALLDRFYTENVVDKKRFTDDKEAAVRVFTSLSQTGHSDVSCVRADFAERARRDQALIAAMDTLITAEVLPAVNRDAAAVFVVSVFTRMTSACSGLSQKRDIDRVGQMSEVICKLSALDLALDSEISNVRKENWDWSHMLQVMPYLVVGLDHVVAALGLLSGQYENDIMRMIVKVVCDSVLHSADKITRDIETQKRNSGFEQLLAKTYEEARQQSARYASSDDAMDRDRFLGAAAANGKKKKKLKKGEREPGQQTLSVTLRDASASVNSLFGNDAPLQEGMYSVVRGHSDMKEDPVYLSMTVDALALKNFAHSSHRRNLYSMVDGSGLGAALSKNSSFGSFPASSAAAASNSNDIPVPGLTDAVQLQALGDMIYKSDEARGCHKQDIEHYLKQMSHSIRVPSPNKNDHRTYPALVIEEDGTFRIAKTVVHAYMSKSALKQAVQDVLSVCVDMRCQYIYGKVRDHNPNIWQTIRAYPLQWNNLSERQKAECMSQLVVVRNPLRRSHADVRFSQAMVNAVRKFKINDSVDLSEVFIDDPGSLCTPGSLMLLATTRYLSNNAISTELLQKVFGHQKVPTPTYIFSRIMIRVMKRARRQELDIKDVLVHYPMIYDEVRNPSRAKRPAKIGTDKTTASVAIELAQRHGFNLPPVQETLEEVPVHQRLEDENSRAVDHVAQILADPSIDRGYDTENGEGVPTSEEDGDNADSGPSDSQLLEEKRTETELDDFFQGLDLEDTDKMISDLRIKQTTTQRTRLRMEEESQMARDATYGDELGSAAAFDSEGE